MRRYVEIAVWIAFWTIAYFVLLEMFASSSERQSIDHIYTAIFTATLMMAAARAEYFRRKYLPKRAYKTWAVNVAAVIMVFAVFNKLLFDRFIDYLLPGYYFISYYSFYDLLKFYTSFVGLTTLIYLSIEWFNLQEERTVVLTGRLNALIAQVNPHFLFNGLTVVYSLSLKDSKETSSAIIKLSDILRYVIYQQPESKVKLSSEAAILRDYIDLQRYRVHPTTRIEFVDNVSSDASVSPMLFLPLVENAFKHGVHGETENAFVRIDLQEDKGVVTFKIGNNKSKTETSSGVGLNNLRERLNLLYPERHSLIIRETENEFNVEMRLHDRGR